MRQIKTTCDRCKRPLVPAALGLDGVTLTPSVVHAERGSIDLCVPCYHMLLWWLDARPARPRGAKGRKGG